MRVYSAGFHLIIIICSSYIALYPRTSSKRFTYYYPRTPVHTNTFSTPQRSMQPGYTLQGATGDQCTIAFSVYCQVLIYGWVNLSTFLEQILPRDSRYRRLSIRRDSNPRSRGWESNALQPLGQLPLGQLSSLVLQNNMTHHRYGDDSQLYFLLRPLES